jgi:hypothetical protein
MFEAPVPFSAPITITITIIIIIIKELKSNNPDSLESCHIHSM